MKPSEHYEMAETLLEKLFDIRDAESRNIIAIAQAHATLSLFSEPTEGA